MIFESTVFEFFLDRTVRLANPRPVCELAVSYLMSICLLYKS